MRRHDPFGFWGRTISRQTEVVALGTSVTASSKHDGAPDDRALTIHPLAKAGFAPRVILVNYHTHIIIQWYCQCEGITNYRS